MRPSTFILALLPPLTSAHTVFTTLFINDVNQGDGTCVRMPRDGPTSTSPIRPITDNPDMACGRDGLLPVPFTCPASAGAKLTFEFREYADASVPGAIDPSHKGPCAVYLKQVANMTASDRADGDGWFKIWESGYDVSTGRWCTEKLIEAGGLLSVALPGGLPGGYFLVRPELVALQQADKGDPQLYAGCAQLFVPGVAGVAEVPADRRVAIPGHVSGDDEGLTFNIYQQPLALPYPIPGPRVFFPVGRTAGAAAGVVKVPGSSGGAAVQTQTQGGAVPAGCLLKNANWCGFEVGAYSDEDGCWRASEECWAQGKKCYDSAPPTGSANCKVWEGKCKGIQEACQGKRFEGPPRAELVAVEAAVPGVIPPVEGVAGGSEEAEGTASAALGTSTPNPSMGTSTTSGSASTATGEYASKPTEVAPEAPDDSCPAEVLSKDGTCGGDLGQTCSGSEFGGCCSRYGRCGSTRLHCGCGCQSAFGQCN